MADESQTHGAEEQSSQAKSKRLDQAHEVQPAAAKKAATHPAATASDAPLMLEHATPVVNQASELAERLSQQQAHLDRRAELVAAEEASIESKLRSARLWFDEQHEALDQREAKLAEQESALDQTTAAPAEVAVVDEAKLAQLADRESELDARQAELYEQIEALTANQGRCADREAKLDARQQETDRLWQELTEQRNECQDQQRQLQSQSTELEQARAELLSLEAELDNQQADLAAREAQISARQIEVEAAVKRFEGLGVTEQRVAELAEQNAEFVARARHLDEAEKQLAEEKERLKKQRLEMENDHKQTQEAFLLERRRIEAERAETQQLASQFEQRSAASEGEIAQRRAALEQLQAELEAGQREVLEMRLATEETWAQLAGALAPATLTRSIAQVRAKLSDHYQHTLREISESRTQLETIGKQLHAEHGRLDEQKAKIQLWAKRREEDIEQRAARLIARERELDRQQQHYEQLEVRWACERDSLRDQVRQLLAEVRQEPLGRAA